MEKNIKKSVTIFCIIAVLCGWLGRIIDTMLINQPDGQSLGSLLWLITPLITAILLTHTAKKGFRGLGLKPSFRGNGRWYLLSIGLFPFIAMVSLLAGAVLGVVDLTQFNLYKFMSVFLGWLIYGLIKNILEEGAWRGFLTERLKMLKKKDWIIYLIVWVVWGSWHIPYYLFYLDVSNPIYMIVTNYVMLLSWIMLFTELYRITGSIWPCVILHAFTNAIQYIMLDNQFITMESKWEILFSPTTGIFAIVVCVLSGLYLRKKRIELEVSYEDSAV